MRSRSATECPCSTILPAALTSPACTFAWLGLCLAPQPVPLLGWAGCHSRHASCEGTGLQPCPTALETARELWLTAGHSRNGAGNGSRLYDVNIWMWRYDRGQPRRVIVAEAELQRKVAISDARKRAADTLKRRKEERGEDYYRKQAQDAGKEAASD